MALAPHGLREYVSPIGCSYYKLENFITPSDCKNPRIMRTFLLAKEQILGCMSPTPFMTDNWEIVVVINCIAFNSPKYGYYVADRPNRTIRWVHGGPEEVLNPRDGELLEFAGWLSFGGTSANSQLTAPVVNMTLTLCVPVSDNFAVA
ncbi:hypothetical protein FRC09_002624 [Ceratobasidium sp. 395]|nr:hypothetical protein FRC09_002624 [Ceratobasidium sp. 395]